MNILTDDYGNPFKKLSDADYLAEIYYPDDVIVLVMDKEVECSTDKCNARQPNCEYSYFFIEKKIKQLDK